MSDKKISQLTNLAANNANSADFLPIVNNGVTKRITMDALKTVLGQLGYVFNNVVFSQADEPLTTPNTLYVYNEKLFYVDSAQNSLEVNIKGNDSVSNTVTLINQPTTEDFLPNTLFIHNDQFYWTDDNAQAFSVVGNAQNANLLSLTLTNQTSTSGYQENTLFTHAGKLYLASSDEVSMPIATEGNAVSFNKISLIEQQGLMGQPAKTLITFNGNLYFVDEENLARKVVLNDTEPKFNEIQLNESASLEGFTSNTLVVKENKLYFIDEQQNAVAIAFGDYQPEDEANKATDFTVLNNVVYPTTLATETQIDAKIASLVNSAPSALNTLNELANALGSDPNFATTTSSALGERELLANKSIDISTDATSDTKYPSVKAVKTYADTKQDNLGFTPENTSNKSTSVVTDQTSNSKYPTVKSVYDWVTTLVSNISTNASTGNALTSNPLSQFAATTSAQLATVISDETGSGALVFGTSPMLSNPIVGTQTANDNSTKAASTAYVDSAISTAGTTYKVAKKLQINCKTAASTLIFTTEANKGRFVITNVWFHADTITSLGFSAPSISVGHTSTNYADFVSNQALPNSSWAANQFTALSLRAESSSRISCPASTGIYVKVVTASDATAYTGTVFIEGFYIG